MEMALDLARRAFEADEVPVGAVVVLERDPETGSPLENPRVIGSAHNLREASKKPTAHAELLAMEQASQFLGNWRLTGCTLYVTLEPCLMCAGTIINSRVDRVVFGALDPKAGAAQSLYSVLNDSRLNHRPEVAGEVMSEASSTLLKEFFLRKRSRME